MAKFVQDEPGHHQSPFQEARASQVGDAAVNYDAGVHQDLAIPPLVGHAVSIVGLFEGRKHGLHVAPANAAQEQARQTQGKADHYGYAPGHPTVDVIKGNRYQGCKNQAHQRSEGGGEEGRTWDGVNITDRFAPRAQKEIGGNEGPHGYPHDCQDDAPGDYLFTVGREIRYIGPQAPPQGADASGPDNS